MVERQSPGTPGWSRADWSATLQLTVAAAIVATPLLALAALYGVGPRVPRFIELIAWLAFGWVLLGRLRA
ncbi:MAG TPA: hypothetical protein VLC09_00880, partial [Polyangiaceae bacterium]|nr:hypothetical protein [Polyangiaceae bacterium]